MPDERRQTGINISDLLSWSHFPPPPHMYHRFRIISHRQLSFDFRMTGRHLMPILATFFFLADTRKSRYPIHTTSHLYLVPRAPLPCCSSKCIRSNGAGVPRPAPSLCNQTVGFFACSVHFLGRKRGRIDSTPSRLCVLTMTMIADLRIVHVTTPALVIRSLRRLTYSC